MHKSGRSWITDNLAVLNSARDAADRFGLWACYFWSCTQHWSTCTKACKGQQRSSFHAPATSQDSFSRHFPNTLSQSMVLLPLSELAQQMLCVCLQTSSASFSITQTCQPKDPGLYHQFESRHQGCLVRHVPAKIAHGGHKLYVWLTADQPTLIGNMLYRTAIASQHAELEAQQKWHLQFQCSALAFPPKDYMLQLEGVVHWWEWQGRQAGGIDNTNEYK